MRGGTTSDGAGPASGNVVVVDKEEEAKREQCADDPDDADDSRPSKTTTMTTTAAAAKHRHHRGSVLRRDTSRNNYLSHLVRRQQRFQDAAMESLRAESDRVRQKEGVGVGGEIGGGGGGEVGVEVQVPRAAGREEEEGVEMVEAGVEASSVESASLVDETEAKAMSAKLEEISALLSGYGVDVSSPAHRNTPLETRVDGFTYLVPVDDGAGKILTVYNSSALYRVVRVVKRLLAGEPIFRRTGTAAGTDAGAKMKAVLDRIDLVIEPGKAYLLLGPPGSGRSTLLKAIAGLLRPGRNDRVEGSICYNGRTLADKGEFHIENAFAYIDQLDKHAPRLTVGETFAFACRCKDPGFRDHLLSLRKGPLSGTTERDPNDDVPFVNLILSALGLAHVKDTFVGDANIRGVSGGQRRRVTVGEMLGARASVLCGDEISTGLDAASTYDMVQVLVHFNRVLNLSRVISLLQPSPETVSLFDEVIVMAEGMILYAGPVKEVEAYFADIGFRCPQFVDVADFLQLISSGDGSSMYDPPSPSHESPPAAPTLSDLANMFRQSDHAKRIRSKLESPPSYVWMSDDSDNEKNSGRPVEMSKRYERKYANSFFVSTWLILNRFLILWVRDRRVILASAAKNIIMGISVGGCYLSTTNSISIQGALFQAGLFIILGAMQSASSLVTDRVVFYKHADANFYSAWPFVFGRIVSQIPQTLFDTVMFATILYYMVGLADRESAANFFIYLSLLFVFALLMNQQLAVFASFASAGGLNAYGACIVLLLILFSGFIVVPDTIPMYYSWIYWWNPFAWVYRGLIVNEFYSGRWENVDQVLSNAGFVGYNGEPYGQEWIGFAFAYLVPYWLLCAALTAVGLTFCPNTGGSQSSAIDATADADVTKSEKAIQIPFKPVTLSFRDVCYDVTASTSSEKLRLLNNVSGIFRPGRLCALMGSSGAGKTTLMDVIAIRKRTGTITGEILMNGWPQEAVSFRRCSGYVYQFDVQSPELTVRETILFSARLRLDPKLVAMDLDTQNFVDQVMKQVELTNLRDVLVGTDETYGLSFEQKKRLSIAVELAASPSVLFLDEPTSGLDARSAHLVARTLRSISDSGRTVVATIHQPSSAVFGMFDDLLLLRKGGQVVYHGELGKDCCQLVSYFESRGAPEIELGDNPANWMLRVLEAPNVGDLAESYLHSSEHSSLAKELDSIANAPDPDLKLSYESEFAATTKSRRLFVNSRLQTIYWRSPSYNLSRLTVSLLIAFVLGSVFVSRRNPPAFSESDMRARLSVVFLAFIISGIQAILSVIPVMTMIRDLYYRHRDAGMYDSGSIGLALGVAEKAFIVVSTAIFTTVFLATSGIVNTGATYRDSEALAVVGRSIGFWGFFTFNFAIYSYFGQLFVCLVKPTATALILCSVFIGLNNFFSGLVVLPQYMVGTFYAVPYYITPGHYVYDGLITCLYRNNNDTVVADYGSDYYAYLVGIGQCSNSTSASASASASASDACQGTAYQYADNFFGGQFMIQYSSRFTSTAMNAIILGFVLTLSRVLTFVSLKYIRHSE